MQQLGPAHNELRQEAGTGLCRAAQQRVEQENTRKQANWQLSMHIGKQFSSPAVLQRQKCLMSLDWLMLCDYVGGSPKCELSLLFMIPNYCPFFHFKNHSR